MDWIGAIPEETTKERLAAEFKASLEAFIAALGRERRERYQRKRVARGRMQNTRWRWRSVNGKCE